MRIPRRKAEELKKGDTGPVYLSEDGLLRLKESLAAIKRVLPELISETTRQADYGDRSDNAAYSEAKSALRRAHWQVLKIEDQLKRVVIISSEPNLTGRVQLGSTVTLEVGQEQKTYKIMGPRETNPGQGRISNLSPLGSALLNRMVGEVVVIETNNGSQKYKILGIR